MEFNSEKFLTPAARREFYYPIYFAQPLRNYRKLMGYNFGSDPSLFKLMEKARDKDEITISPIVNVSNLIKHKYVFFLISPIYELDYPRLTVSERRERFRGFAVGMVHPGELLQSFLEDVSGPGGVDFYIFADVENEGRRLMHFHPSPSRTKKIFPVHAEAIRRGIYVEKKLKISNQSWSVVYRPVPGYFFGRFTWAQWIAITAGTLLTLMGAIYLNLLLRRTETVERLVDLRTEELTLSNAELSRLATAIEYATDMVVIRNAAMQLIYANPAFEKIFGYTQEEILGTTPEILRVGKDDKMDYEEILDQATRGVEWRKQVPRKKKDGTVFNMQLSITPIKDATGTVVNYVTIARDVSYEVELEERLRQAQKMEAIGTLAGGIAHDFNNILTPILLGTDMTLSGLPEDSPFRPDLMNIERAGMRAKELVNQILTFSRQSEAIIRPFDLLEILKEALKLLRSSIPATIDFQEDLNLKEAIVTGDPTEMHQVIMNLSTNASFAMAEDGGVLGVSLTEAIVDEDFIHEHSVLSPGPHFLLVVSDTGHGMSPEVRERIFEPFFTTKKEGAGTGMGLSVVHGIIAGMGGDITVHSEAGRGTTFHIYIPRSREIPEVEEPSVAEDFEGEGRILLVDDEEEIVTSCKEVLERVGYDVVAHTSSLEALEAFQAAPEAFDLVITDQTMPNMTGDKLLERILEVRSDMRVIICSGFNPRLSPENALAKGNKAFIPKPFTIETLKRTVRKVLDEG